MWKAVLGRPDKPVDSSSKKKDEPTPKRKSSVKGTGSISRSDERGIQPSSTAYSSSSKSPYPGTAAPSIASSYQTAQTTTAGDIIQPELYRNPSLMDTVPRSRTVEDDKKSRRRDRSTSRDRKSHRRDRSRSEERIRGDKKDRKLKRRSTDQGLFEGESSRGMEAISSRGVEDVQSRAGPSPISNHVPDMFPGQFPSDVSTPYRPPLAHSEGGPGLAADYYNPGPVQSSSSNPRPQNSNSQMPLIAPSSSGPPPSIPSGASTSFYNPGAIPSNPRPSDSQPSQYSQNSGPNSSAVLPAVGIAAAGAAAGYMMNHQSESTTYQNSSYQGQSSRPSGAQSGLYQGQPPTSQYGIGTNASSRPSQPGKQSSSSNIPYAAAGAAALGAAAYYNHQHHDHNHSGNTYGGPSTSMAQKQRSSGPLDKIVDFFKDPEGVARFEEYSEAVGICRGCFEPGSTPRQAPRRHNARARRSSERLRPSRVDKDNRYYVSSSDEGRRRSKKSMLGVAAAGIGLGAVGRTLMGDFDDTYSVKSGKQPIPNSAPRPASQEYRRDSYSTKDEKYSRRSDRKVEYGITADGSVYKKGKSGNGSTNELVTVEHSHSRSSSSDSHKLKNAAAGAIAGAVVGSALNRRSSKDEVVRVKHRSRSRSSERRRRRRSPVQSPGLFGGFFSAPSSSRKNKHSKGFFTFSNGSSSSDSSLAFGGSDKESRRRLRRRRSSPRIKTAAEANAALLGLGAATAALAAHQNGSRKLTKTNPAVIAVKTKTKSDRSNRSRRHDGDAEDGWESASEASDTSVDSALAFGFGSKSRESLAEAGTDKWNWRWGSQKRRSSSPRNTVPHQNSGMSPAAVGIAGLAAGTALAGASRDSRKDRDDYFDQKPMKYVEPVSTSDPRRYDATSYDPKNDDRYYQSRPGNVPLQQPQPIAPVPDTVYSTGITDRYGVPVGDTSYSKDNRDAVIQPKSSGSKDDGVRFDLSRPDNRRYQSEGNFEKRSDKASDRDGRGRSRPGPARSSTDYQTVLIKPKSARDNEEIEREEREDDHFEELQAELARLKASAAPKFMRSKSDGTKTAGFALAGMAAAAIATDKKIKKDLEQQEKERQEAKRTGIPKPKRSDGFAALVLAAARNQANQPEETPSTTAKDERTSRSPAGRLTKIHVGRAKSPVTHESYASYFAPDILSKPAKAKETNPDPNADVNLSTVAGKQVSRHSSNYIYGPFENEEFDPVEMHKYLPWKVPQLGLINPTPPASRSASAHPSPMIPPSEPTIAEEVEEERERDSKSKPSKVSTADDSQQPIYTEIKPRDYQEEVIEPQAKSSTSSKKSKKSKAKEAVNEVTSPVEEVQRTTMPGQFDDDLDFAATLAAGAAAAGFDPDIVIEDPTYRRRDSPPGADSQGFYRQPFYQTVSDIGLDGPPARPIQHGFVEGEVPDTPKDEIPRKDTEEEFADAKLSKKEQRKKDKAAKRQTQDNYTEELPEVPRNVDATPIIKPETPKEVRRDTDPEVETPSKKRSKSKSKGETGTDIASIALAAAGGAAAVKAVDAFSETKPKRSEEPPKSKGGSDLASIVQAASQDFETKPKRSEETAKPKGGFDLASVVQSASQDNAEAAKSKAGSSKSAESRASSQPKAKSPFDMATIVQAASDRDQDSPRDVKRDVEPIRKDKPEVSSSKGGFDLASIAMAAATSKADSRDDPYYQSQPKYGSKSPSRDYDEAAAVPLPTNDTDSFASSATTNKTKSQEVDEDETEEMFDSPGEYAPSAYTAPVGEDGESKRHKKKKRRSKTFDDTASIASSPAKIDEAKDTPKKKGGIFGLFGKSSSAEPSDKHRSKDVSEVVEPVEESKKKKKSRKSRDGDDFYSVAATSVADLSKLDDDEDDRKSRRRRSRKSIHEDDDWEMPTPNEKPTDDDPMDGTDKRTSNQSFLVYRDSDEVDPGSSPRSSSLPPLSRPGTPPKIDWIRDDAFTPARFEDRPRRLSMINTSTTFSPNTPSPTAVPLVFRRPPSSASGVKSSPIASPGLSAPKSRKPRPQSVEFRSNEFRPLWLVTQYQPKQEIDPEEVLPSLPSSHSNSRSSSIHEDDNLVPETPRSKFKGKDLDIAAAADLDLLDSEQTTPTAASYRSKREQDLLDQARQEAVAQELEWNQKNSPDAKRRSQETPTKIPSQARDAFKNLGIAAAVGGAAGLALHGYSHKDVQHAEDDAIGSPKELVTQAPGFEADHLHVQHEARPTDLESVEIEQSLHDSVGNPEQINKTRDLGHSTPAAITSEHLVDQSAEHRNEQNATRHGDDVSVQLTTADDHVNAMEAKPQQAISSRSLLVEPIVSSSKDATASDSTPAVALSVSHHIEDDYVYQDQATVDPARSSFMPDDKKDIAESEVLEAQAEILQPMAAESIATASTTPAIPAAVDSIDDEWAMPTKKKGKKGKARQQDAATQLQISQQDLPPPESPSADRQIEEPAEPTTAQIEDDLKAEEPVLEQKPIDDWAPIKKTKKGKKGKAAAATAALALATAAIVADEDPVEPITTSTESANLETANNEDKEIKDEWNFSSGSKKNKKNKKGKRSSILLDNDSEPSKEIELDTAADSSTLPKSSTVVATPSKKSEKRKSVTFLDDPVSQIHYEAVTRSESPEDTVNTQPAPTVFDEPEPDLFSSPELIALPDETSFDVEALQEEHAQLPGASSVNSDQDPVSHPVTDEEDDRGITNPISFEPLPTSVASPIAGSEHHPLQTAVPVLQAEQTSSSAFNEAENLPSDPSIFERPSTPDSVVSEAISNVAVANYAPAEEPVQDIKPSADTAADEVASRETVSASLDSKLQDAAEMNDTATTVDPSLVKSWTPSATKGKKKGKGKKRQSMTWDDEVPAQDAAETSLRSKEESSTIEPSDVAIPLAAAGAAALMASTTDNNDFSPPSSKKKKKKAEKKRMSMNWDEVDEQAEPPSAPDVTITEEDHGSDLQGSTIPAQEAVTAVSAETPGVHASNDAAARRDLDTILDDAQKTPLTTEHESDVEEPTPPSQDIVVVVPALHETFDQVPPDRIVAPLAKDEDIFFEDAARTKLPESPIIDAIPAKTTPEYYLEDAVSVKLPESPVLNSSNVPVFDNANTALQTDDSYLLDDQRLRQHKTDQDQHVDTDETATFAGHELPQVTPESEEPSQSSKDILVNEAVEEAPISTISSTPSSSEANAETTREHDEWQPSTSSRKNKKKKQRQSISQVEDDSELKNLESATPLAADVAELGPIDTPLAEPTKQATLDRNVTLEPIDDAVRPDTTDLPSVPDTNDEWAQSNSSKKKKGKKSRAQSAVFDSASFDGSPAAQDEAAAQTSRDLPADVVPDSKSTLNDEPSKQSKDGAQARLSEAIDNEAPFETSIADAAPEADEWSMPIKQSKKDKRKKKQAQLTAFDDEIVTPATETPTQLPEIVDVFKATGSDRDIVSTDANVVGTADNAAVALEASATVEEDEWAPTSSKSKRKDKKGKRRSQISETDDQPERTTAETANEEMQEAVKSEDVIEPARVLNDEKDIAVKPVPDESETPLASGISTPLEEDEWAPSKSKKSKKKDKGKAKSKSLPADAVIASGALPILASSSSKESESVEAADAAQETIYRDPEETVPAILPDITDRDVVDVTEPTTKATTEDDEWTMPSKESKKKGKKTKYQDLDLTQESEPASESDTRSIDAVPGTSTDDLNAVSRANEESIDHEKQISSTEHDLTATEPIQNTEQALAQLELLPVVHNSEPAESASADQDTANTTHGQQEPISHSAVNNESEAPASHRSHRPDTLQNVAYTALPLSPVVGSSILDDVPFNPINPAEISLPDSPEEDSKGFWAEHPSNDDLEAAHEKQMPAIHTVDELAADHVVESPIAILPINTIPKEDEVGIRDETVNDTSVEHEDNRTINVADQDIERKILPEEEDFQWTSSKKSKKNKKKQSASASLQGSGISTPAFAPIEEPRELKSSETTDAIEDATPIATPQAETLAEDFSWSAPKQGKKGKKQRQSIAWEDTATTFEEPVPDSFDAGHAVIAANSEKVDTTASNNPTIDDSVTNEAAADDLEWSSSKKKKGSKKSKKGKEVLDWTAVEEPSTPIGNQDAQEENIIVDEPRSLFPERVQFAATSEFPATTEEASGIEPVQLDETIENVDDSSKTETAQDINTTRDVDDPVQKVEPAADDFAWTAPSKKNKKKKRASTILETGNEAIPDDEPVAIPQSSKLEDVDATAAGTLPIVQDETSWDVPKKKGKGKKNKQQSFSWDEPESTTITSVNEAESLVPSPMVTSDDISEPPIIVEEPKNIPSEHDREVVEDAQTAHVPATLETDTTTTAVSEAISAAVSQKAIDEEWAPIKRTKSKKGKGKNRELPSTIDAPESAFETDTAIASQASTQTESSETPAVIPDLVEHQHDRELVYNDDSLTDKLENTEEIQDRDSKIRDSRSEELPHTHQEIEHSPSHADSAASSHTSHEKSIEADPVHHDHGTMAAGLVGAAGVAAASTAITHAVEDNQTTKTEERVDEAAEDVWVPTTRKDKKSKKSKKRSTVIEDQVTDARDIIPEVQKEEFAEDREDHFREDERSVVQENEDWELPVKTKKGKKGRRNATETAQDETITPRANSPPIVDSEPASYFGETLQDEPMQMEPEAIVTERAVEQEPMEDSWTTSTSSKKKKSKKSRASSAFEDFEQNSQTIADHETQANRVKELFSPIEPSSERLQDSTPIATTAEPEIAEWSAPTSKKSKKGKRKSSAAASIVIPPEASEPDPAKEAAFGLTSQFDRDDIEDDGSTSSRKESVKGKTDHYEVDPPSTPAVPPITIEEASTHEKTTPSDSPSDAALHEESATYTRTQDISPGTSGNRFGKESTFQWPADEPEVEQQLVTNAGKIQDQPVAKESGSSLKDSTIAKTVKSASKVGAGVAMFEGMQRAASVSDNQALRKNREQSKIQETQEAPIDVEPKEAAVRDIQDIHPAYRDSAIHLDSPVTTDHQGHFRDSGFQSDTPQDLDVAIEVDPHYQVTISSPTNVHTTVEEIHQEPSLPPIEERQLSKDSREPSPVHATSRERSAALFGSSPSTRNEPSHIEEFASPSPAPQGRSIFGGAPIGYSSDRELDQIRSPPMTPTGFVTPSKPLTTIAETSPDDLVHNKQIRPLSRSDNKARRSGIGRVKSPHNDNPRKLGLISTDDLISRLSWPEVDEEQQVVNLDRTPSRNRDSPAPKSLHIESRSDRRSASGNSVESNDSINAIIRSPPLAQTPPLRRSTRSLTGSGDLRTTAKQQDLSLKAASKSSLSGEEAGNFEQNLDNLEVVASSSTYDPVKDKGKSRGVDMADVYEGYGDVNSPRSPTRPNSVRRRQSLQILDLETRLDQLVSENRLLVDAKNRAERGLEITTNDSQQHAIALQEALQTRDQFLAQKDEELLQLKTTLQELQSGVTRLGETSREIDPEDASWQQRYNELTEDHEAVRGQLNEQAEELEDLRSKHTNLSGGYEAIVANEVRLALQGKDAELEKIRAELETAKQQVRALQQQILAARNGDEDGVERDEDYFEQACQDLCKHMQQFILRFSKFSDMHRARKMSEVNDEKVTDRFDVAMLDGTDVDLWLGDRIKRRDVFMAVTSSILWEYIFTRYLFGMDREQRSKLKALEKTLSEVGSPAAIAKWRSTTLKLLSQREPFQAQREQDTEAVVQEISRTLSAFLPPPSNLQAQVEDSLRKIVTMAVDLSIEMRTQKQEYIMLAPIQPAYSLTGDLEQLVYFNAASMNERSGAFQDNSALEQEQAVVTIVLFPLVLKNDGTEQEVIYPAQVLVQREDDKGKNRGIGGPGSRSVQSFAPSQAGMI